jgi:hypothetical protein
VVATDDQWVTPPNIRGPTGSSADDVRPSASFWAPSNAIRWYQYVVFEPPDTSEKEVVEEVVTATSTKGPFRSVDLQTAPNHFSPPSAELVQNKLTLFFPAGGLGVRSAVWDLSCAPTPSSRRPPRTAPSGHRS